MKTETYPGRAVGATLRELAVSAAYFLQRVGDLVAETRAMVDRSVRLRDDANVLVADVEDWELVCSVRVNVWLKGPQHTMRGALAKLGPSFVKPVVTLRAEAASDFLPPARSIGTLILEDAAALGPDDQQRILAWLDDVPHGTRVISTTSAPILPLIETGAFLEPLYYRLNTLYVDLTPECKQAQ